MSIPNRTIKYLSPTGISAFRADPEKFYSWYLSGNRTAKDPQTQAMAIGSAFDAYAKSHIHERLFGAGNDPKYSFQALFESQVESQWRDWAKLHGFYVFDKYKDSGALADLMLDLQQAVNVPKFEIEIYGTVQNVREGRTLDTGHDDVTFLGKPDVFFINKHGAHIIIDWKVNGYVSAQAKSPMPGYVRLRLDNNKTGSHPGAKLKVHSGVLINVSSYLEELSTDWATQLTVYAWLLGCGVGGDFIAGIDQICCAPTACQFPELRVAEHRLKVREQFQFDVFKLAQDIWRRAHSGHFFTEMPLAESQARCQILDDQALILATSQPDELFLEMTAPRNIWRR